MLNNISTTRITLWVNRLVALIVAALLPTLPYILRWYTKVRTLTAPEYTAVLIAFYCCAAITAIAQKCTMRAVS